MDLEFCFIDISKLKSSESLTYEDYVIFSKTQNKKFFKKRLTDIILTTFYIYQDTVKTKSNINKLFQFDIVADSDESNLMILATIENWNYALLIGILKSSLLASVYFKNYVENLTNLLKFLFGTLSNSFLKHKQETSLIIDKAIENYTILNLQKPYENLKSYPNLLEELLMEFASMFNRHEKEYILISDVYLIRDNRILFARDSEHLLELFIYHSVIRGESEGIHPKYYFHKIHSNISTIEQQYSLLISNCYLTIIVIFNCQLKDIKSPPVSLIRRSRGFIRKISKYIKENVLDVKLQNYCNIDELTLQIGRKENKLFNWFRSRSLSLSMNDKITEENKIIIRIFGDSVFASSSIYGLKYRNNIMNYRFDFPLKIGASCPFTKFNELNRFFTNVDEEMKDLAADLQMKSFEITHFIDLSDNLSSKRYFIKILGIYDDCKKDWLLICVKDDCPIELSFSLNNIRQFLQY